MKLIPYTDADIALTEAAECDPAMMAHLGGPWPREAIPEIHRKRLEYIAKGAWYLKIIPDASGVAAGTISFWESEHKGEKFHEVGWMVLPAFQGRGIATAAVNMLVTRVRAEGKIPAIHAFPGADNAASNAICRKLGFVLLEQADIEYKGRPLHCNHWRLDLRASDVGPAPRS